MVAFIMKGFRPAQTHRTLFSHTPRLTLRQVFNQLRPALPDEANVTFFKQNNGIAICIQPQGQPDKSGREAMLSYQFFPEHHSVVIRRIDSGPVKRGGLGTAMIAAQLPFWLHMRSQSIAVRTHDRAEGFYRKLGFTRADDLPEYGESASISTLMRLDLQNPEQRAQLECALAKAPSLHRI